MVPHSPGEAGVCVYVRFVAAALHEAVMQEQREGVYTQELQLSGAGQGSV